MGESKIHSRTKFSLHYERDPENAALELEPPDNRNFQNKFSLRRWVLFLKMCRLLWRFYWNMELRKSNKRLVRPLSEVEIRHFHNNSTTWTDPWAISREWVWEWLKIATGIWSPRDFLSHPSESYLSEWELRTAKSAPGLSYLDENGGLVKHKLLVL